MQILRSGVGSISGIDREFFVYKTLAGVFYAGEFMAFRERTFSTDFLAGILLPGIFF
jgi:hypothetical protein